eukprot:m.370985 g.370985  ORF g.370985 m.370985 type:complete len:130 (-) comp16683_c0_seq11:2246-2635(-)
MPGVRRAALLCTCTIDPRSAWPKSSISANRTCGLLAVPTARVNASAAAIVAQTNQDLVADMIQLDSSGLKLCYPLPSDFCRNRAASVVGAAVEIQIVPQQPTIGGKEQTKMGEQKETGFGACQCLCDTM